MYSDWNGDIKMTRDLFDTATADNLTEKNIAFTTEKEMAS